MESAPADTRPAPGGARDLAVLLGLLVLALAAWSPALGIGPLGDDFWLIGGLCDADGALDAGRTADIALARDQAWLGPGRFLRPVWRASYALDALLVPHWEGAIQALNLLLHVACAWLVFALVLALSHSRPAALLAGALFAAFPAFPEAVAWGAARTDLLATVFLLATALVLARGGARTWAALLLLAALGSKESAVVGAPLVLVIERTRDSWSVAFRRSAWAFALVAGWLLLRRIVFGGWIGGHSFQEDPSLFGVDAWLSRVLALPRVAFPFAPLPGEGIARWTALLALLTLGAAVAWRARRIGDPASRGALVGAALLILALVPLHGLSIPGPEAPLPGTRHAYLLSAGWCVLFASVLLLLLGRPSARSARAALGVFGAIAVLAAAVEARARALECAEAGATMARIRATLAAEAERAGAGPLVAHGPLDRIGWLHIGAGAFPSALHPPFAAAPRRAIAVSTTLERERAGVDAGLLGLLVQPDVELRLLGADGSLEPHALPLRAVVRGRVIATNGPEAADLDAAHVVAWPAGVEAAGLEGSVIEARAGEWRMDHVAVGLPVARDLSLDEVTAWEPLLERDGERLVLRGTPGGQVALLVGDAPGCLPLGGAGALLLAAPALWLVFLADADGRHVVDPRALRSGSPGGAGSPRRVLVQPVRVDGASVQLGARYEIELGP